MSNVKNSRRIPFEVKINEPNQIAFTYSQLNPQQRELALNAAIEIKARERAIWENILAIGNKLIEVKQALGHGHFVGWIDSEFQWSVQYARKYMKIAEELKPNGNDRFHLPNSLTALYQLAAGLGDAESDEEKTALLDKVEETTEQKGKPLTEAELKAIRDEIEEEFRSKQENLFADLKKANQQIHDAKYKMEMVDRENQVLQLEAKNAKQFKQQYEETYKEKRLVENELRFTKKQADEAARQLDRFQSELEKEKDNAVKAYISKHSDELAQQKAALEQEISQKQNEIQRKNSELETLKLTYDISQDEKYREIMLRQLLVKFADITQELSQNQVDLLNAPFVDHLTRYKSMIAQLKTWVEILEDVIAPLEVKTQTIDIKRKVDLTTFNNDLGKIVEGSLVTVTTATSPLAGGLYEVIHIKGDNVACQVIDHHDESLIGDH